MGKHEQTVPSQTLAHEREIDRVASMTIAGQFKPEVCDEMEQFELFERVDYEEQNGHRLR